MINPKISEGNSMKLSVKKTAALRMRQITWLGKFNILLVSKRLKI